MKITLITTSFNSAGTIEDTIKSVIAQTYQDIEYTIIDGASTDNTLEIARSYEPLFEGRMRIISEPDKGIYDGLNTGLRMATGDVIGILNSDDFFTSNHIIETAVSTFKEDSSLEMVYGDVHYVKNEDLGKCVRYYSSKIFRPWLFRFGFMPAHPSCYIRRECFDKYGLYSLDYKIAADFELLLRFVYKARIKTKYLPLDFVTMRMGGVSTAGIASYIAHNKEDVSVCKKHGIWTCFPLILLKYLYKIFELR